jgi:glutamyl-tRNA reductase
MHRLLLLGLNHTTAPLEVREKLAFNAQQCRHALAAFRSKFEQCEAVLLSTCNRVELYTARAAHGHPTLDEMVNFLAEFHGVAPEQFHPHVYHKRDRAVVEHLFAVTASLDSMVLGETQILGQVRDAYDLSRAVESAGGLLNPLFQRAVGVGKQVMRETSLGDGRLSVASVAVDYARQIFETFTDKTVLFVGAGKMATLKPRHLLLCNRDPAKAAALAQRFGGEPVPYERLDDHLVAADIVVSSTGSAHPIITRKQFARVMRLRRYRTVFLMDIAVPRDVEAAVADLHEHVYLRNLDDLQQVVQATAAQRSGAVEAARRIVAAQVDAFAAWLRAREMGPAIERLFKRHHAMALEELARARGKLSTPLGEQDEAHLEEMMRRVVNKLLHHPVQVLRRGEEAGGPGAHAPPGGYLRAFQKLFQLGDEDTGAGDGGGAAGGGDETAARREEAGVRRDETGARREARGPDAPGGGGGPSSADDTTTTTPDPRA